MRACPAGNSSIQIVAKSASRVVTSRSATSSPSARFEEAVSPSGILD
jgi:hypothetical protein